MIAREICSSELTQIVHSEATRGEEFIISLLFAFTECYQNPQLSFGPLSSGVPGLMIK